MNVNVRAVLAAALVIAAVPASAAEPEERPDWSIGAGLGLTSSTFLPSPTGAMGGLSALGLFGPSVPVATFFVERRLGDRTWLVLGAAGSVTHQLFEAPPDTGAAFNVLTQDDSERVSVSAGLRRVVTRPGAVVEVSLQGTFEAGYLHEVLEFTSNGGAQSTSSDTGGYASLTGGIAVERELTGGLGLRISTPLLGASYAKLERKDPAGSRDASSGNVFVTLAPRLELRLAF